MPGKKLAAVKVYTAVYELDESGWWAITVKGVPGCRSQARNIETGRERIREALSLFVDDAERAEITEDYRLDPVVREEVKRANAEREAARKAQEAAQARLRSVVQKLLKTGMSLNDAGKVLGVTKQRVHQLASSA